MRDALIPKTREAPAWRDRLLTWMRRKKIRGFPRLYGLLKPVGRRRQLRAVTRYGSQFFLTPWDSVDNYVLSEGFYESEVLEAVRPALGSDAVLWVIGANFGLHAITAKWLHPETTVIAFEPSPAMGARLLENCELNEVSVALHSYALSDHIGAMPFFANASGNPGMSTLHPVDGLPYDNRFVVSVLTAKQIIEQNLVSLPTAIILDAEGAELEVLKGFGPYLASKEIRVLVFEAPNEFLENPSDELFSLVSNAGFSLKKLQRCEKTGHALSNFHATRA